MPATADPASFPTLPSSRIRPPLAAPPAKNLLVRIGTRLTRGLAAALSTEADRGTLFLFVPVLLAAGAILYYTAPGEPAFYALWASAVTLAVLTVMSRGNRLIQLALLSALIVMLGVLIAKFESWRAGTKVIGSEISTRLTGRVVLIEHQANGRVRLTVDVIATARPVLRHAPDRVRVSAREIPAGVIAGSEVVGVARLRPPSGPVRPDGYDFSFESYFDGIGANGFFLSGPDLVEASAAPGFAARFRAAVENTRAALARHIRERIGGVEGEIAAALVVGVRAGIPEPVNEALRRTGLAHILSISGLHMALVAATIMGALRAGFALFPDFASRRPVKKYAASAALVAIAVYLFISGSAVAAERSFIMLAVMLTALLFDRAALTMRNLAIAALVVIVWSPHEVAGPSFQMSFAATAALIGAYAWWSNREWMRATTPDDFHRPLAFRLVRKGLHYAGGLALTSLIAGVATTPYGAYHFQRISPFSLAANLAAMPVVSAVVMPAAVLGMVAMPFGLDGPVFDLMGKGLSVMLAIAEWFSERSPLDAVGIVPPGAVIILTIALAISALCTTWLRLAALPFLCVGLIWIGGRQTPDVLVSEDARLIAMRLDDENVAVNRSRPSSFTIQNWQRALQAADVMTPKNQAFAKPEVDGEPDMGFSCQSGLCLARHRSGAVVAHAGSGESAKAACDTADLIVVDDASVQDLCAGKPVAVITKRDLARRGSAEIFLLPDSAPAIDYAISEPYRPWHSQRQFSREARGLPPYRRLGQTSAPTEND
ncbi:competence protein [Mesorhizobium albiziae]|nr:competence protein [Mesorhizobium albiziae]